MLDVLLQTSGTTTTADFQSIAISLVVSLVTGLAISTVYMRTNPGIYSRSLAITLVFMPAVISTIIMLVGQNIAAAFSLAGIFTIIRFRSAPGSAKDILLILFSVGAGLAYGVELYVYGLIFTAVMLVVQTVLYVIRYANGRNEQLQLKIVAPDDTNNETIFSTILEKYVSSFHLDRIGTRDLGTVYELVYTIEMPPNAERKALVDMLRRHNGNMNITIGNRETVSAF